MRSTSADPRLILFDIDGTLLKCGPQIRAIFASSLVDVFGTAGPLETYDFAGRTDHGIVLDLMTEAGIGRPVFCDRIDDFEELYVGRLEESLDGDLMSLMPGVLDLLERLERREDVLLGLLTGNFERGARIKLERLDLSWFFAFGAFGDGAAHRSQLPPVALEQARVRFHLEIDSRRVLIVGDSVLDVTCARQHGIPSLAVATGFTTRLELEAAGADWVAGDLIEAERCHALFEAPL